MQRVTGNRSVGLLVGRLPTGSIQRTTAVPLGAIQRSVVQREDPPDPEDPFKDPTKRPDPLTGQGGPYDPGDKGFTCGLKNGRFTCGVDPGAGDPLELPGDWSKFGPSRPDRPDAQGPGNCPPGMYNKLWMKCCPPGTHADDAGNNCVKDQAPTIPLPPPEPEQPGDYPEPNPNADQQVG